MRKFAFLIVLSFFSTACSPEQDDSPDFYLEVLPVKDVVLPSEFILGQTYEIKIKYEAPNECYSFKNFTITGHGKERTVGIVNSVEVNESCNEVSKEVEVSFDFTVDETDLFVFKFYQGWRNNQKEFIVKEIPVIK